MDYRSQSALGIKINYNKFFVTKKVKSFDHNYLPFEWEFDPMTGKKLWVEKNFYNSDIFPEFENVEFQDLYDLKVGSYPILPINESDVIICLDVCKTRLDNESPYHSNNSFVAFLRIDPVLFIKRFDNYKKYMENNKLWNDTFGLYSSLDCTI